MPKPSHYRLVTDTPEPPPDDLAAAFADLAYAS